MIEKKNVSSGEVETPPTAVPTPGPTDAEIYRKMDNDWKNIQERRAAGEDINLEPAW